MTGLALALTAFGCMLVGIFLRVPIALAMGLTGFFGSWYVIGVPTGALAQLKSLSYETFSNPGLAIV
ncbi:MAG: C4-dicarboxylate ABC transporter permease, partial [Pseudomonadota bacterium]